MPTIEDAIAFAALRHKGQKDKIGAPYIYHLLDVMFRLNSEEEKILGVLHDSREDQGVTSGELRDLGYSEAIIEALDYVTKKPSEEKDYDAFIERIRGGPILAIKAKLADLASNTDPKRLTESNEKTRRRQAKYEKAIEILQEELTLRGAKL